MVSKKSANKGLIIGAALEEAGLDNPVSVVAIINAVSAVLAALHAVEDIREILKREKGGRK